MDDARVQNFGLDVAPGSASDAIGSDLRDDELMHYPEEDDGDE